MHSRRKSMTLKLGSKTIQKDRNSLMGTHYITISLDSSFIPCFRFDNSYKNNPVTLIYFHSAEESLPQTTTWLEELSMTLKLDVISFEYPSYIDESEVFSEQKLNMFSEATYRYVIEQIGRTPSQILLYGKGGGCGPALYLAYTHRKEEIAGVVLINPTIRATLLSRSLFEKSTHLKKIKCPIQVVCGELLPEKNHARKLYSLFLNRFDFIKIQAASMDLERSHTDQLTEALIPFLCWVYPEYESIFSGDALIANKPKAYENPFDIIRTYLSQGGFEDMTELLISFGFNTIEEITKMTDDDFQMFELDNERLAAFKTFIQIANTTPSVSLKPRRKRKIKKRSYSEAEHEHEPNLHSSSSLKSSRTRHNSNTPLGMF